MGIIVLTVAILPILGIGGMQLFVAEAPGISPDKFQPRIKETAKRLWIIYIGFTGLEMIFLMVGDMTFFDALNHSLTTMASGGFSTKNSSIAYYDSAYIDFIIVTFMFLAGTNFTMIYFGLHGRIKKVFQNQEFRLAISFKIGLQHRLCARTQLTSLCMDSNPSPADLQLTCPPWQVSRLHARLATSAAPGRNST